MLERLRIFSASLICFGRAVDDTHKLAGLLIAVNLLDVRMSIFLIVLAMGAGGLLLARRDCRRRCGGQDRELARFAQCPVVMGHDLAHGSGHRLDRIDGVVMRSVQAEQ